MTFLSYAQNLEDVLLYRALRQVDKGFYIDVGAQHPVNDSVTKAFYERGWHGINIDPVPQWIELLRKDRPHDTNLQVALGAHSEHKQMFVLPDTGLSTDNPAFLQRHLEAGYAAEPLETEVETLDAVCERHGVGTVHFLKIDVEGAETAVIRGFSFGRVRPWIVLVEAVEPVSAAEGAAEVDSVASYQEWEPLLLGHDYLFACDDGLNRYYVAAEKRELLRHFSVPANTLDAFVRYQEWLKHERILQLDGEIKALTDANALASRRAELEGLDALRRDSANRLRRIGVLEQECAALQGRMAATQSGLEHWRRRGEEAEQRVARLAEVEYRLSLGAQREQAHAAEIAENRRHAQNRLQRISELEQESASLRGQLGIQQALAAELGELRAVAEQRAVRIGGLEQQVHAGTVAGAAAQAELDALREKFAELSRHSAGQDALLHMIMRSRSWRLTRPLRWLQREPPAGAAPLAAKPAAPPRPRVAAPASAPGGTGPKAFVKRILLGLMRRGRQHPRLQRAAGGLLAVAPRFKARLVAMRQANGGGHPSAGAVPSIPVGERQRSGRAPWPEIESSAAVHAVYARMCDALTSDGNTETPSHERDVQG